MFKDLYLVALDLDSGSIKDLPLARFHLAPPGGAKQPNVNKTMPISI